MIMYYLDMQGRGECNPNRHPRGVWAGEAVLVIATGRPAHAKGAGGVPWHGSGMRG